MRLNPVVTASVPLVALLCLRAQSPPDYVRDVRPILETSCYGCHSEKVQSGGLRLDLKSSAMPKLSLVVERISGAGTQQRMPLGGAPLSEKQISTIKAWVSAGAVWPDTAVAATPKKKHWAFVAPVRPALPAVKNAPWARNPIDRFILAKLEAESLAPSGEAAKSTLLRRLSLDLTGLPPTPEELDAYLKDTSPRAYEKQVDRLLASPHYGEKWARHWLDGARYADSDGYEKDKPRFVWFYRDYVINAFNRNLPYNQFVTEQLAGDLLPNATQDQRVATGFLRNSMINEEGGVDPEQFRMEAMYDRMDAIGKNILGITIQCAQCHTHKYDPIQHEDYYRLFAFLNNSNEGAIAVYTPAEQAKIAELRRKLDSLPRPAADAAAWKGNWTVVRPEVDDISTGGQRYLPQPDGSLLAQGYAPTKHTVKLTIQTPLKTVRAIRLELLNDPNLPLGGPGRSIKGTGALSEIKVEAAPLSDANAKPAEVKIASASADLNLPEAPLDPMFADKSNKKRTTGPIAFAIDGVDETAWGFDAGPVRRNQPREAVFNFATPIANEGGSTIIVYLKQNGGGWNSDDNQNNNLGRIRLSFTEDEGARARPEEVLSAEAEALWKQMPEGASQLVLNERAMPRETHLLNRGDFLQPGKTVTPGVPAFLNPMPAGEPANRLGLAKWLTSREAPTTARSFVNRVWQAYFGIGIIETSEDLGTQSSPASHPELLDWLAVEFMEKGWDVKALQRLIVTSATYRQSSKVSPELEARDPYNRLLARGPRFRVDSEIVRDIALSASGLLDPKVGGPSVNPPSPAFLYLPPTSYGPKVWNESKGSDRYRRALYTFRFRSVPYPMLQAFDSPTGEAACVRRARSNTPLQALTTLNEPLFLDAAKALAAKTEAEGGADSVHRLNYMYRRVLSREPSKAEVAELAPLAEKRGWTVVARVVLNLDETITKE